MVQSVFLTGVHWRLEGRGERAPVGPRRHGGTCTWARCIASVGAVCRSACLGVSPTSWSWHLVWSTPGHCAGLALLFSWLWRALRVWLVCGAPADPDGAEPPLEVAARWDVVADGGHRTISLGWTKANSATLASKSLKLARCAALHRARASRKTGWQRRKQSGARVYDPALCPQKCIVTGKCWIGHSIRAEQQAAQIVSTSAW